MGEGFLPPRHLTWVHDRRKRRHADVFARIFQCHHQRTVATHRMAADGTAIGDRKLRLDERRQLIAQIIVHPVMTRPGLLGGIQVEPGAFAQIVTGIVCHIVTARAGVGHHQRDPQLRRNPLGARFGGKVFIVAGQAGKPVQHRRFCRTRSRRQKNAERHRAVQHRGVMTPALLSTFKTVVLFEQFHARLLQEGVSIDRPHNTVNSITRE